LHDEQWPELHDALHSVGVRNLSLWNWENRLFFYAEYIGDEPFEEAMKRYAVMPRVQEWEELMHNYQQQLPGSSGDGDVWWQPMSCLYHQA
jgi:L-rhamnose mutarotase